MASYTQLLYHIVICTYKRRRTLTKNNQKMLYKYIWGILKKRKCILYKINGVEDHIHILCSIHTSIALADLVKEIKVASNSWIKKNQIFSDFFGWGAGYFACTCSYADKNRISQYIENQKHHHLYQSFSTEEDCLLEDCGILKDK